MTRSLQTLVPIAIVVIQALGARPSNPSDEKLSRKDKPSSRSERERWRHSLPFILISWGLISCASALAAPRSTFICPVALSLRRTVPLWQLLNSVLDIIILLSIFSLIHGDTGGKLSLLPRYPVMIGIACIVSGLPTDHRRSQLTKSTDICHRSAHHWYCHLLRDARTPAVDRPSSRLVRSRLIQAGHHLCIYLPLCNPSGK